MWSSVLLSDVLSDDGENKIKIEDLFRSLGLGGVWAVRNGGGAGKRGMWVVAELSNCW